MGTGGFRWQGVVLSLVSLSSSAAWGLDCAHFSDLVIKAVGEVRAKDHGGYTLEVVDRVDGRRVCENSISGDRLIYPASSVKTIIALTALEQWDRGQLDLDRLAVIDQSNAAVECADWDCAVYGPGKQLPVRQLIADMLIESNNLATNQMMDIVGKPAIAELIKKWDLAPIQVVRKMYNLKDPEAGSLVHNQASASAMARLYRELSAGRQGFLLPASRKLLLDWLGHTHHNERLNRQFPANVIFFHKTGATSRVSADSGFYFAGPRYAVVIATLQEFVDYQALVDLGKTTFDWLKGILPVSDEEWLELN